MESGLSATRRNVIAPGAVGIYSGGSIYNPAQVLRDDSVATSTRKMDEILRAVVNKERKEFPIEVLRDLIALTRPDQRKSERVWNAVAVGESLVQFAKLHDHKRGYVYVDRERGLKENRRETQGILDGGEAGRVPNDKVTLFLLRTRAERGSNASWWPQIRFPDGPYAFAFAV